MVKTFEGSYFRMDGSDKQLDAAKERVFSMIKKDNTIFRFGLDIKTSLTSIIIIKMN